jgi:hypothetical protein
VYCMKDIHFHLQSAVNVDDKLFSDALRVDSIDNRVIGRDVLMDYLKMTTHL